MQFGGTPQRGTPQWKTSELRDSPAKNTRSQQGGSLDEDQKASQVADWSIQLSPGLNLDTCHFLASPNPAGLRLGGPDMVKSNPGLSPAVRRSGRRTLTPLKRKWEESGLELPGPGAAGRLGRTDNTNMDTPDVMPPVTEVETVKRQATTQYWRCDLHDPTQPLWVDPRSPCFS